MAKMTKDKSKSKDKIKTKDKKIKDKTKNKSTSESKSTEASSSSATRSSSASTLMADDSFTTTNPDQVLASSGTINPKEQVDISSASLVRDGDATGVETSKEASAGADQAALPGQCVDITQPETKGNASVVGEVVVTAKGDDTTIAQVTTPVVQSGDTPHAPTPPPPTEGSIPNVLPCHDSIVAVENSDADGTTSVQNTITTSLTMMTASQDVDKSVNVNNPAKNGETADVTEGSTEILGDTEHLKATKTVGSPEASGALNNAPPGTEDVNDTSCQTKASHSGTHKDVNQIPDLTVTGPSDNGCHDQTMEDVSGPEEISDDSDQESCSSSIYGLLRPLANSLADGSSLDDQSPGDAEANDQMDVDPEVTPTQHTESGQHVESEARPEADARPTVINPQTGISRKVLEALGSQRMTAKRTASAKDVPKTKQSEDGPNTPPGTVSEDLGSTASPTEPGMHQSQLPKHIPQKRLLRDSSDTEKDSANRRVKPKSGKEKDRRNTFASSRCSPNLVGSRLRNASATLKAEDDVPNLRSNWHTGDALNLPLEYLAQDKAKARSPHVYFPIFPCDRCVSMGIETCFMDVHKSMTACVLCLEGLGPGVGNTSGSHTPNDENDTSSIIPVAGSMCDGNDEGVDTNGGNSGKPVTCCFTGDGQQDVVARTLAELKARYLPHCDPAEKAYIIELVSRAQLTKEQWDEDWESDDN